MIEFIKLGAFAQIITISFISSLATLIFRYFRKETTKKELYLFNVFCNLLLILFENIILYHNNLIALVNIGAVIQIFIYWYGAICVSQLFYDKAKEILIELEINLIIEIFFNKTKNELHNLIEKLKICCSIMVVKGGKDE